MRDVLALSLFTRVSQRVRVCVCVCVSVCVCARSAVPGVRY